MDRASLPTHREGREGPRRVTAKPVKQLLYGGPQVTAGQESHTVEHTLVGRSGNKGVLQRTEPAGVSGRTPCINELCRRCGSQRGAAGSLSKGTLRICFQEKGPSEKSKGSLSVHLGDMGDLHSLLCWRVPLSLGLKSRSQVPAP